ncbi:hypothetical protein FRB97_003302 [Tulasnella sp. 331]|nr:hypothetical protein FRB97_003302 [Tulasnella sp. 331]
MKGKAQKVNPLSYTKQPYLITQNSLYNHLTTIFNIKGSVLALTAASTVLANHLVTIHNYCGQGKYGHVKSAAFNDVSGLLGTNGGTDFVSIPALASSLIIFGESGECPGVDGPGCTRFECDFRTHRSSSATCPALLASVFLSLGLGPMAVALEVTVRATPPARRTAERPIPTRDPPSYNATPQMSVPQPEPRSRPSSRHGPSASGDFDFLRSSEGALSNLASAPLDIFSRVTGAARATNVAPAVREVDRPSTAQQRVIRCAQAYSEQLLSTIYAVGYANTLADKDIYVGCSDGTLIRYSVRDDDSGSGDPYAVASQQSVPGNKSIDKITLVPSHARALVLSGGIVHFYSLPAFDPLPPSLISPIRGVVEFALDELAVQATGAGAGGPPVRLCIIRRRNISVYALRDRLTQVKDIPLPAGATLAKLSGPHLCIADRKSYWIINVDAAEALDLMDWSHVPLEENSPIRPILVVTEQSEFMLVVWTGNGSLGFFMSGTGDPVRGTMEYPQHPISICVDHPYIAALLPNDTIEIHSLATLSIVAVLPCPTFHASQLSRNLAGYLIPSARGNQALQPITVPLLPPTSSSATIPPPRNAQLVVPKPDEKPALSRSTSARSTKSIMAGSFTRSKTLAFGGESIQALLPSTLVSQIASLLDAARLDDATELAAQAAMPGADSVGNLPLCLLGAIKELFPSHNRQNHAELDFINQRIGFQLLKATRFEEAGSKFLIGDLHPLVLIKLFPELRGQMVSVSDEISVFSGVAEDIRALDSIDELVMANLVRNYHPHIKPSVEKAPATAELRRIMNVTARDMLLAFLRNVRPRWTSQISTNPDAARVVTIIDTVLVKIFAEEGRLAEVQSFIQQSDSSMLAEVEPLLARKELFSPLSMLIEREGDEAKILELWTKLIDGKWSQDTDLPPNLMDRMIARLTDCKDHVLVQRYGIWLVKRNPQAGFNLFTAKDSKRGGIVMDEALILRAIRVVDADLGEKYLEHLVLSRRNSDQSLHGQLVTSYLDRLSSSLRDPQSRKSWEDVVRSYISRPSTSSGPSVSAIPFLGYISYATVPSTVTRVKLGLLLQGSTGYDLGATLEHLEKEDLQDDFAFEKAILNGRLGNHRAALSILVQTLHDSISAEAYCTLGGDVISSKIALAVGKQLRIEPWANLVVSGGATGIPGRPKGQAANGGPKVSVPDEKRRELLKILMEVYMAGGRETSKETAHLLNAQAVNLDVLDVLESVPPAWSLSVISSFLSRSLRRTLHAQHEGQIIKAIAAGQNLEVADAAYEAFREEGALVEEPLDYEGDDHVNDGEEDQVDENVLDSLTEKAGGPDDDTRTPKPRPIPVIMPNGAQRPPTASSLDSARTPPP